MGATASASLEIGLHRRDVAAWSVELRFTRPGNDAEDRTVREDALRIDFDALRELELRPDKYGEKLAEFLFADREVRDAFVAARVAAASDDLPLRVRLYIGPSAPELHRLRWETLRVPSGEGELRPIALDERTVFSRFLTSSEWRRVGLLSRVSLRALVAVAGPTAAQPSVAGLAPVDLAGEVERATAALGAVPAAALIAPDLSLATLVERLREGFDILYLVCHGTLDRDEPYVLLHDDAGAPAWVRGRDLVEQLERLRRLPRLAVLVSCQSGSTPDSSTGDGALAALGPRLAQAGIPAVVAMQGDITIAAMGRFMPVLLEHLERDGEIDQAMAAARNAIRDDPDWWKPVLYLRLLTGRIWYSPGFAKGEAFEQWPGLLSSIERHRCTPVLGIGMTDSLIGSRQEIAQQWARTFRFPMAEHLQNDLPQVAQYVASRQGTAYLPESVGAYLRRELVERYPDVVPRDEGAGRLDAMLAAAWRARSQADRSEPFSVLAALPLPIYITTHPSSVLTQALADAGRQPETEWCRWNDDADWPASVFDTDPGYRPTLERPLVVHLFGTLALEDSLVITEDDYFDFLISVTREPDLLHPTVRASLVDGSLLFLGFRMEEWDFRVLFRTIMRQGGRQRRAKFPHVSAQIDPEEGDTIDPERARAYLSDYFREDKISLFWGSVDDFTRNLHAQRAARAQ